MRALLLVTAFALAPDRPDLSPQPPQQLRAKLQGQWQVTVSMLAGKPHTLVKPGDAVFVFEGDRMLIRLAGDREYAYTFTLDESKNPAVIDIVMVKSLGKDSPNRSAIPGIARVEGDVLTLCIQTGHRPTEFASTPDAKVILWQLKRIK
jgi:uncharacterized protein (TIGR03067 family)